MTRNKDNMHFSKYKTNKQIKEKIDKLLLENSQIWSNLGTGTSLDLKTREKGERRWKQLARKIKELDEQVYNRLCPYGIDS